MTQPLWVDRWGESSVPLVIRPTIRPRGSHQTAREWPVGLHNPRTGTGDLSIIDLTTGQKSRFTFDGMHNNEAVWSPEGRQLVFVGRPDGVRNLHLKPVDGSTGDEPLLAPGHDRMPLDWSRDGRHILFREESPETSMDVWVLRMPERRPIPFLRTAFPGKDAKFSPDGRWVAYMSNETGREEIYVASFPEGTAKRKVSARWRARASVEPRRQRAVLRRVQSHHLGRSGELEGPADIRRAKTAVHARDANRNARLGRRLVRRFWTTVPYSPAAGGPRATGSSVDRRRELAGAVERKIAR